MGHVFLPGSRRCPKTDICTLHNFSNTMAGIKRKEAPKAVAAVRSGSEKKQKLASTGSSKKKAAPIKEPTPESDESSESEDELDGDDDAMSGVELEAGNSESDDKKIRSRSSTRAGKGHTTDTSCSWSIIRRGTRRPARSSEGAQGRQTQRRHHRPQQEDLGETAQEVACAHRRAQGSGQ